jgi:hypothetical protein
MEVPGVIILGPHLTPEVIRRSRLGPSWTISAELEDWTTWRYRDALGTPEETKRFRVRVSRPLPGNPSGDS